MPLRKKSFGCQCSHSWTSCITSSLSRNLFRPDAPLGGRRGYSLREQGPEYIEDVVECFISVSGWCPWCEQPRVDGRYPWEMTLMFAPFFSCSWWLSLLGLREVPSNILAFIVRRCVRKSTYSTPLESQKMVAITFPAENVVFAFFGFRRFWVKPLQSFSGWKPKYSCLTTYIV